MTQTIPGNSTTSTDVPAPAINLPPGPRIPKSLGMVLFALDRRRLVNRLTKRFGAAFTVDSPIFGPTVFVTEPDLARQVFLADPEDLGNIQPNLSRILGSGSVFALDGAEHRRRRNLLSPPFHGKSVRAYEQIIIEETLNEIRKWPTGTSFETLGPMNRITLNVILRAIFGAEGAELDQLRVSLPKWVTLGSRLVTLPMPIRNYGRYTPWGKLAAWRDQYERILDKLIDDAQADPNFAERTDVLTLLLSSTYDDGTAMTRREIADELLTLLAAGHETTASTMAWVFERLCRHPELLDELTAEADTDANTLRRATIREVQRVRTVIDFAGRHVYAPSVQIGEWVIPRGHGVIVGINQIHQSPEVFCDPERFDPRRFLDGNPSAFEWLPYGGGSRRCPGSTFANLEMDLVLRTVLRQFTIEPTTAPGEKYHSRGVAFTPKQGGRITVRPRA
ncbi:cytochrome P450 [Mycolicibacter sp. MYC123]|uniref:Cytochrome P450 n=1 Tax=[Mycobacterium] zoologicum TaxID=2872311 RepID=A0ABU5YLY1_9MYCO|nr:MULTISPECIES: cytochrome P450 [unclassified Mycolicibacter]MEB3051073.1 cytochrome P450 [Mycolicibacter sp. MYC123]MEB3064202.1 cytochrome P450 [Mycolicibacter sp. MYC101]